MTRAHRCQGLCGGLKPNPVGPCMTLAVGVCSSPCQIIYRQHSYQLSFRIYHRESAELMHAHQFLGTIDGAAVHPREVVKRSLKVNAAAVILAHNVTISNAISADCGMAPSV